MPTYGQILRDIEAALTKQAFIPPPSPQGQGGQPGQAGPPQGQPGMDATGAPQGQPGAGGPPDPSQGMPQDPSQGQPPQDPSQGQAGPPSDPSTQPQDPSAVPGGDLAPKAQAPGLKQTMVTLSVADLLDLHSNGKATGAHLKTESLKVKHQFEHRKLLKDEQRKEHEDQMKQQQEQAMQAQQQQGMMGGGIYGSPMDGSQPPAAQPQQPQQPGQPGAM